MNYKTYLFRPWAFPKRTPNSIKRFVFHLFLQAELWNANVCFLGSGDWKWDFEKVKFEVKYEFSPFYITPNTNRERTKGKKKKLWMASSRCTLLNEWSITLAGGSAQADGSGPDPLQNLCRSEYSILICCSLVQPSSRFCALESYTGLPLPRRPCIPALCPALKWGLFGSMLPQIHLGHTIY